MSFVIETPRLVIRNWKESDIPAFISMNQDPDFMAFYQSLLTPEETKNRVASYKTHIEQHGFGFFAVELKKTEIFIGSVGLDLCKPEMPFSPAVQIGWGISKEFWNQGYATEAAKAVLKAAFTEFDLKEVVASTAIPNKKSMWIMEKIGMRHDPNSDFYYPDLDKNHWLCHRVLYRIKREDFLKIHYRGTEEVCCPTAEIPPSRL